jgi:iron complex transport system ATP-binding protein
LSDRLTGSPPLIELKNVTLMRGDRMALDALSLSIGVGEHVAIIGPNGSGKSSLIKAITRECWPRYTPEGSLVRLLGRDRWHVWELRTLLGIVTNDLMQTCTRDVSGRELILSGFFSSVELCPWHEVTPEMRRKTEEVMELLEVTHLADRMLTELSSGEARRLLIARALVHDPQALILDEPTNSLDLRAQSELRAIFRKLAQNGTSIILVTHYLPDIIPEISRVILIKNGRLFRDGSKEDVLRSDILSELFGGPVEVLRRNGYYYLW